MIEPINDENNTKVIIKILRVDWLNINSRKGAIFCKVTREEAATIHKEIPRYPVD